jgi:hypothetical protein
MPIPTGTHSYTPTRLLIGANCQGPRGKIGLFLQTLTRGRMLLLFATLALSVQSDPARGHTIYVHVVMEEESKPREKPRK